MALGKSLTCSARRPVDGPAVLSLQRSTSSVSSVPEYEQKVSLVQDRRSIGSSVTVKENAGREMIGEAHALNIG